MLFSNEKMDTSGGVLNTIEPTPFILNASSTSQVIFFCPAGQQFKVIEVRSIFATASTSGTVTVEYLTGTTAPGGGVPQTAAIALSGTANTTVVTPVIAANVKVLNPGDRLNAIVGGTMTGLVNAFVQVSLIRVK